MDTTEPSIVVFINSETKEASFNFRPQNLSPEQYGVVISSLMTHIAKLFRENNPEKSENQILSMIGAGIDAGLSQLDDTPLPTNLH